MKKKKKRRALWITAGVLALLSLVFFLLASLLCGRLSSQQAAQRWQGESDLRFSQVSCFLPVDEKLQPKQILAFREEVHKALHAASVDVEYSGQLQVDAWSTHGKVHVSTDLGSGEASVIAVGGDFFQFHPVWLLSGNYISESDFMKDRVLLDKDLAWLLFGGTELAGMELKINGLPFIVAGVIEREQDRFSRLAYQDGMGLYMSYEAYSQMADDAGIDCYELVMASSRSDGARSSRTRTAFAFPACLRSFSRSVRVRCRRAVSSIHTGRMPAAVRRITARCICSLVFPLRCSRLCCRFAG